MNGLPRCSRFVVLKRRKGPTKSPLTARGHVCTILGAGGIREAVNRTNRIVFLSFSPVISFRRKLADFWGRSPCHLLLSSISDVAFSGLCAPGCLSRTPR